MRLRFLTLTIAASLMSQTLDAQAASQAPAKPVPPTPDRRPKIDTLHGDVRRDDFAWMRNREDPALTKYLTEENAYTDAMMARLKPLEDQLYKEILGRVKETDDQVPALDHGWYYYTRTEQGKAYPIFARKRTLDGKEEVYLDQNEEAKPYKFYQLGGMEVSPDGNLLAALVDTNGYEDFVLRVKDLRTNKWLDDRVEKLSWGLAWASDNKTMFYVSGDSAKRPDKVWRHVVGTPKSADVAVYHEPNVLFNVSIERSRSGAYVFIQSGSFTQDEWRAIDANNPTAAAVVIAPRAPNVEYTVDHGGSHFYIVTNRDNAVNFKVMRAAVTEPSRWSDFVSAKAATFVEGIDVFQDWLVRSERREGLRRIMVRQLSTNQEHEVTFQDAAYGVSVEENPEFATQVLRFSYSSLITPPSVYDYNMSTKGRDLKKQQEVLGGYDPTQYTVERRRATSWDGTAAIPISLVYKGTLKRDGQRPLLLYAYGSYGATTEPTFNSARFSLIDRGFVFAIAHVRGGQEMGRTWYDNGKMMKKMNTFTDFNDVADFLIGEGYTSKSRLVAHGGSAGGLLMGVISNLHPQKYRAIVADVPFVDVINTMLDASIPLTAQEWEQWGNPNKQNEYRYMLQYSPYDNVAPRLYPWMLVMSGLNDSRVAYWEPAKWVAKMRLAANAGGGTNPLLLKMNMGAGHGGSSGRYDRYRETAFRYTFMLDAVGLGAAAQ